jgi:hypothetical protein
MRIATVLTAHQLNVMGEVLSSTLSSNTTQALGE